MSAIEGLIDQGAELVHRPSLAGRRLLGLRNFAEKETRDWTRSRRALVVAIASTLLFALAVLLPWLTKALVDAGVINAAEIDAADSFDATLLILSSWSGNTVALIVFLATMTLMTGERDRGTLAWSLTKPLSRNAFLVAKWAVSFALLALTVIAVPLAAQVVLATLAYGGIPDLVRVVSFGLLYLPLLSFYCALAIALGVALRSTAAVAGIAFVAVLIAAPMAGLIPGAPDWLPTSMGTWAIAIVEEGTASPATPIVWLASMILLAIVSKTVFERQDF